MSLYGAPLWDLFSSAVNSLEYTYNRSVRLMWNLPIETHRYLIEPVSQQQHMIFILYKRQIGFKSQVNRSSKKVLKHLYSIAESNCNSITGRNLRKIMLLCNLNSISDLNNSDIDKLEYSVTPEREKWRIRFVEELLNIRHGKMEVTGFTQENITEMLDYVCVS